MTVQVVSMRIELQLDSCKKALGFLFSRFRENFAYLENSSAVLALDIALFAVCCEPKTLIGTAFRATLQ